MKMKNVYKAHAQVCKTIAHAKRLEILDLLRNGEMCVNDLAKAMEVPAANVSQQLAVLRSAGVVRTRQDGTTVYYRVASPKILRAYDLMSEVMQEQATALAEAVHGDKRPKRRSS
jgi:DNA-binding transcriptional ArsR family regulator